MSALPILAKPGNELHFEFSSCIHDEEPNLSIFKIEFLTKSPYFSVMTTIITSKGQITIPKKIRERFNLKVGDELEFDETAPTLTARRVINRKQWNDTICEWQDASSSALENHPWQKKSSDELIDDIRGGVAES